MKTSMVKVRTIEVASNAPGAENKPEKQKQKREAHVCPRCGKRFYYWRHAEKHAAEMGHWGHYA